MALDPEHELPAPDAPRNGRAYAAVGVGGEPHNAECVAAKPTAGIEDAEQKGGHRRILIDRDKRLAPVS